MIASDGLASPDVALLPPFIAPARFDDAEAALAHVREIYDGSIDHLRGALQRFVAGEALGGRVRACYPFVRVHTDTVARADSRLSYGFVAGPGRYETTLTRPDLFGRLLPRAVPAAAARTTASRSRSAPARSRSRCTSRFAENDHIEGTLSAERRAADARPVRPARPRRDGRRHRQRHATTPRPGEAQPLALFTAARVDYSLHRLRHYTGTAPEHFQNFVLFTNYQFYIDEFVRARPRGDGRRRQRLHRLRRAGQRGRRAAPALPPQPGDDLGAPPPRLPQMPAYHLVRADRSGITMVNIGVGPANAKTITDHIAVLRPHAWMMLGHCAGLRNTPAARRLRAGPRLRARGPRARRGPAAVGADPGAGRDPARARGGGGRGHAAARATS